MAKITGIEISFDKDSEHIFLSLKEAKELFIQLDKFFNPVEEYFQESLLKEEDERSPWYGKPIGH